jgi:hypothetical protein
VSFARRVDWKPDANGKLDAQEKWDFKEPLTKVLSGTPNDELRALMSSMTMKRCMSRFW